METNEQLQTALLQEAEQAILQIVEQLQTIREGDLQALEQQILTSCLALGRTVLEQTLTQAGEQARKPTRREGECGHPQRLVGMRPRQLHTLMGKVTLRRAYYQCIVEEEGQHAACSHGQVPFDRVWNLSGRRSSPGVQKLLGNLFDRTAPTESVET